HYKEDWYPRLLDRNDFDTWKAAGGKTLRERARERVEEILSSHRPEPLPKDVQSKINAILEEAH
ncbi:MAG: trimethylamine methyltransferase family protein, partial [Anaerolineae bacterium]